MYILLQFQPLKPRKKYTIHQIWGGLFTLIHHNYCSSTEYLTNIMAAYVTECKKLPDSSHCQQLNNVHGVTMYII